MVKDSVGNIVKSSNNQALPIVKTNTIDPNLKNFTSNDLPPLSSAQIKKTMDLIANIESSSSADGSINTNPISTEELKVAPSGVQYYGAYNRLGYIGKYQFGYAVLKDLGYTSANSNDDLNDPTFWTGKDNIKSKEDFFNSPRIQESIMFQYMQDNYNYLLSKSPTCVVCRVIGELKLPV